MTKPRPKTLTDAVVVRMDPELHNWIRAQAAAGGRTVSQTIRFLLKQARDSA